MGRRSFPLLAAGAALLLLATAAWFSAGRPGKGEAPARIDVSEALSGEETAGFARAYAPRRFRFPEDHGPHPAYRNEWWYYTGNVRTAEGRRFGYQLTVFRIGLTPRPAPRGSDWAADQVFLAHFALSDVSGGRFHAFERASRGALELAGARALPFRVWVEDWNAQGTGAGALPVRIRAAQEGVSVDLTLDSAKPPVLQGDRGLSRKSAEPGNASYYYSFTRMPTRGTIRVGPETFRVEGLSWMDREWSTSALGKEQAGWDWFSLQLSDGRELMLYRMRRKDGTVDPHSAGTLVDPAGRTRPLSPARWDLRETGRRATAGGTAYPSGWTLRIPAERLSLTVAPALPDQELRVSVHYWEGAVDVRGEADGKPVSGSGYVEMTGYAGRGNDAPGASTGREKEVR